MPMSIKTRNRLEMLRGTVACEVPARHAGCRAFAAIYSPREIGNRIREIRGDSGALPDEIDWVVRRLELRAEFMESPDDWDHYVVGHLTVRVKSLDDAEAVLASWGVDSSQLDGPWKCDYPL